MPDIIELEKPNAEKVGAMTDILDLYMEKGSDLLNEVESTMSPAYLYWDKVKYKSLPAGLEPERFWGLVKLTRQMRQQELFVVDKAGKRFSWQKLERFERFLHKFDKEAAGSVFVPEDLLPVMGAQSDQYVLRGIIEEAIASSQLEGAHTTRSQAQKMIREGRKPGNAHEQMIMNNYRVMRLIQEEYRNRPMSEELLVDLQARLTEKTEVLDEHVGRFRRDSDDVTVGNEEEIGFVPPNEEFMRSELARFIEISNDREGSPFLHPVIKAIVLHFWVGYLHPFADGNGRLARAVFYWYLLREGYWAIAYLPISTAIKQSAKQYSKAYIYSEQDDSDLTYFIDYNISKMQMAIRDFGEHLTRKYVRARELERQVADDGLNARQRSLLSYLLRHAEDEITIRAHQRQNSVSRLTARKDLYDLLETGYLEKRVVGRRVYFRITQKALDRLG